MKKELPVFSHWLKVVGMVLERAGRFPKGLRPTLGNRLLERSLNVLEHIVALRYTRERTRLFREANLDLEHLRVLTRLCFEKRLISARQYQQLAEGIDACGRMIGGWRRSLEETAR